MLEHLLADKGSLFVVPSSKRVFVLSRVYVCFDNYAWVGVTFFMFSQEAESKANQEMANEEQGRSKERYTNKL